MNYPAASSGVSPGGSVLFAASGGELYPMRLKRTMKNGKMQESEEKKKMQARIEKSIDWLYVPNGEKPRITETDRKPQAK